MKNPPAAESGSKPGRIVWLLSMTALGAFGLVLWKTLFHPEALQQQNWPEALLLCCGTAAVIASVSTTLPFQNVLWAALVAAGLGGLVQAVVALAPAPFGGIRYTEAAGSRILGVVPWTVPMLWALLILTARGMARWILRAMRSNRNFGLWQIGLTSLLALTTGMGLDRSASRFQGRWSWETTGPRLSENGIPVSGVAMYAITSALLAIAIAPLLINKKPGPPATESGSATGWVLLNILFLSAAVRTGLWINAALIGGLVVIAVGAAAITSRKEPSREGRKGREAGE